MATAGDEVEPRVDALQSGSQLLRANGQVGKPGRSEQFALTVASNAYSDVDASGQVEEHAAYLDRVARRCQRDRHIWLEHLALAPGVTVLDAGSGMGEVVRMMAERVAPGGRAIGIDLSAEMVARASERAAGVDAVEYRVGSVTALPFEVASVDAAYSERVFMHLADPQAAMHELFRVLRPGGRIVVIDRTTHRRRPMRMTRSSVTYSSTD